MTCPPKHCLFTYCAYQKKGYEISSWWKVRRQSLSIFDHDIQEGITVSLSVSKFRNILIKHGFQYGTVALSELKFTNIIQAR